MNFLILYLLLLKATLSSFSGLAALPIVRNDFVVKRHLLTDHQLNTALVVGRSTPGPKGLYLIAVGYFAGGAPGAIAAWLAVVTPAVLVIPLLISARRKIEDPRVKRALRTIVVASAGVSLSATLPLSADALINLPLYGIAAVSLVVLVSTTWDTLWVMLGASLASLGLMLSGWMPMPS
jgi:chromate transporter